ncbi:MAG: EAL domain-containing protein [Eubacteriales bacterium]|nr:EAL domain-containing protein [Eubacteriales bacterium]
MNNNNQDKSNKTADKLFKISTNKESLKFLLVYIIIGFAWILFSDTILEYLIDDMQVILKIQTYKGWLYVFVTGIVFYLIIRSKLVMIEQSANEINESYMKLEKNSQSLADSEQRYRLVVEGSNDGIWDWDLINDTYVFTIKSKPNFGYEDGELTDSFESWKSIYHPEDWLKTEKYIRNFLDSDKIFYENTYRLRCKNGEYRWILSKGKAMRDKDGKPMRITGSHTDITDRKQMEEKVNRLAYYDQLTELPNRFMIEEIGIEKIDYYRNKGEEFAFVLIDIDNFKHINDTMGHKIGDQLILHVKDILSDTIKPNHVLARTGGDEFSIIITDSHNKEEVLHLLDKILSDVRKPWLINDHDIFISISAGLAFFPEHGHSFDEISKNADTAMTHIKESDKDGYAIYHPSMIEKTWQRMLKISKLRNAIKKKEFYLDYQPIYNIADHRFVGVEALIRWKDVDGNTISPGDFIPLAEETGLIHSISEWVFQSVCDQLNQWDSIGFDNYKIAMNLSGKVLTGENLTSIIKNTYGICDSVFSKIEFEITETAVINDFEKAIIELNNLKKLGIKISLDDFGSGYSSLTYLQKLPLDSIKIDRDFIKHILSEDAEESMFKSIVDMAHDLGLNVIAEGVETEDQLRFVRKNGCDMAQGYYLGRPVSPGEIETILKQLI